MKRAEFAAISLMAVIGCTRESDNIQTPSKERIFASIEQPASTKVYADEELKVLWNEEDLISFFNKLTLNEKWMFMGETGDNAGYFSQVTQAVGTGNELDYYCAVYPYNATTRISNQNVMTLSLPAEQTYMENSFGLGANTMVAVSSSSIFSFKNVCGYLSFKLYGDGVKVKSISLKGNNNERLAGKGTIPLAVGTAPVVTMADTATDEITLVCQNAVELNSSASDYTEFWLVVPPVEFTSGFTVTITDENGGTITKSTSSKLVITRSNIKRMAPIEVEINNPSGVISFKDSAVKAICVANWDTDGDGELSYVEAAAVTDIGWVFASKTNITTFEELCYFTGLTSIRDSAFESCSSLTSINIPDGVTSIRFSAFSGCSSLTSINIPDGVTSIGSDAFMSCSGLTSINIPDGVTSIQDFTFSGCSSLTSITIPDGVTSIGSSAFRGCSSLTSINIPDGVTSIGSSAFNGCSDLTSITLFHSTPPTAGADIFVNSPDALIYVPSESVDAYKSADGWSDYADRIQAIPTPGFINGHAYVDMGDGLKWATCNIGANSPEEYGDYFAWGETVPYYESISENGTVTWKEGKSSGYDWSSYTKFTTDNGASFTKYTGNDYSTLQSDDDAATANWGGTWRIPTKEEWTTLKDNYSWTWTTENGVPGQKVTSNINGNSIFLPAAGNFNGTTRKNLKTKGLYWDSTLFYSDMIESAWDFYFDAYDIYSASSGVRYYGLPIRPVSN